MVLQVQFKVVSYEGEYDPMNLHLSMFGTIHIVLIHIQMMMVFTPLI